MSKLGSFALVLAVICLQVVFALGEHATKNESSVCSSTSPVEVARLVDIIAANNEENANKIKAVKELLASPSTIDDVAKMFQTIVSTQQENAREIKDLKELIAGKPYNFGANSSALEVAENSSSFGEVANMFRAIVSYQQENAREIKNMKKLMALIASKQQENAKTNKKSEPEQQEDSSLNTSKPCPESSKQSIISSLVSECLVVLFCFCCDHRVGTRRRKCSHR